MGFSAEFSFTAVVPPPLTSQHAGNSTHPGWSVRKPDRC